MQLEVRGPNGLMRTACIPLGEAGNLAVYEVRSGECERFYCFGNWCGNLVTNAAVQQRRLKQKISKTLFLAEIFFLFL